MTLGKHDLHTQPAKCVVGIMMMMRLIFQEMRCQWPHLSRRGDIGEEDESSPFDFYPYNYALLYVMSVPRTRSMVGLGMYRGRVILVPRIFALYGLWKI